MVNVLPFRQQQMMRARYYAHLVTLFFCVAAGIFLLGAVLLSPSYFLAREQADASERYRNAVAGTVDLKGEDAIQHDTTLLNERIRIGSTFEKAVLFTPFARDIARVPRVGIHITSFSLTRSAEGTTVMFDGIAETRGSLISFAENLRSSGSFDSVALPVSQLVSEEDIVFSIKAEHGGQ